MIIEDVEIRRSEYTLQRNVMKLSTVRMVDFPLAQSFTAGGEEIDFPAALQRPQARAKAAA